VLNKAVKLEATTALKAAIEQGRRVIERRKAAGDAVASAEYAWRAGLASRAEELVKDAATAPALALRARLLLERGRLRDALRDAEAALKASPDEPLALLVRGRVGLERDTPGHLADLEKAVKQTGRADADALSALAEALAAAGRRPDAVKAAKEALALRPKDAALAALLSRLEKGS